MTIDCEGSVGLTQMAGSSALSPLEVPGTVSRSAVTRIGAASAGDWNAPAPSSVHSAPMPIFESNRRLITVSTFRDQSGGNLPFNPLVLRLAPDRTGTYSTLRPTNPFRDGTGGRQQR